MKKIFCVSIIICAIFLLMLSSTVISARELTPSEQLGEAIFFDENLSINKNQSCASCHKPEWGWTGPDSAINDAGAVYEGSIPGPDARAARAG